MRLFTNTENTITSDELIDQMDSLMGFSSRQTIEKALCNLLDDPSNERVISENKFNRINFYLVRTFETLNGTPLPDDVMSALVENKFSSVSLAVASNLVHDLWWFMQAFIATLECVFKDRVLAACQDDLDNRSRIRLQY